MNKRIQNCWVSPDGRVIYCNKHELEAVHIVMLFYPNEILEKHNGDLCDFLIANGWARFCNILYQMSGSGWVLPRHLTTNQKNKIFDLTEEWFDEWKREVIPLSLFYKYSCNLSTSLSFHITFINENKSGVCLALHNWIRKNIAKSPTFHIYHHSLNSALLAA